MANEAAGNVQSARALRRIVTGHDREGRSTVWLDDDAKNQREPADRLRTTLMWITDKAPDYTGAEDTGSRQTGIAPPPSGSRFSMLQIAPGNRVEALHRTDTIDYVICLQGRIDLLLDTGSTTLEAGDVVIQRGTTHGWQNRFDETATLAVVLVDAGPKRTDALHGHEMAT
jgi:quercetin dioxygenase-like cupin family protein